MLFNLFARDVLLVYFFTTIGINSSLKDLFKAEALGHFASNHYLLHDYAEHLVFLSHQCLA
ncbi:hypothetical protein O9992_18640 [Vibrio lentus]|nr:hypothetical protein [Vibrio lentus]